MKLVYVIVYLVLSFQESLASVYKKYATAEELKNASGNVHITCSSDTKSSTQTHVAMELEKNELLSVKILSITPHQSVMTLPFFPEERKLKFLKIANTEILVLSAKQKTSYFDEDFSAKIYFTPETPWPAEVHFDDGDGISFSLPMLCGASNGLIPPN